MRRGLTAYFAAHRHGVAATADFVAALSTASGLDVGGVLQTFLDQPGTPLVSAALHCDSKPRVTLRQRRSLPLGSSARSDSRWRIPVCVPRRGAGLHHPRRGDRHNPAVTAPRRFNATMAAVATTCLRRSRSPDCADARRALGSRRPRALVDGGRGPGDVLALADRGKTRPSGPSAAPPHGTLAAATLDEERVRPRCVPTASL